jgi:hypothetical protein
VVPKYYPLPEQTYITVFITPRLHEPYQGSSANVNSQKHLIFSNSGILTSFEGGVTGVVIQVCSRGETVVVTWNFTDYLINTFITPCKSKILN